MKRLAIIAGGWHFPAHCYATMASLRLPAGWTRDLFCLTHRNPDLEIVRAEKVDELSALPADDCGVMDRKLYDRYASISALDRWGWKVQHEPNTVGDWGFFNQWLDIHDYTQYDMLLNCHDDTFIRDGALLRDVLSGQARLYDAEGNASEAHWLILGNGCYPQAPTAYVRGSFEFWKPRLLELLGGRIDLGDVKLTREGLTDSPPAMEALMPWNDIAVPVRDFMVRKGLAGNVLYLSPHYRISRYLVEGERGFISRRGGAPWSFKAGLKEFAEVAA